MTDHPPHAVRDQLGLTLQQSSQLTELKDCVAAQKATLTNFIAVEAANKAQENVLCLPLDFFFWTEPRP